MNTETFTADEILKRIISEMVAHPKEIEIVEFRLGRTVDWKISVHPEDESRVIGTGGGNVRALKRLAIEIGRCQRILCGAEVVNSPNRVPQPHVFFAGKEEWNAANLIQIASDVADILFPKVGEVRVIDGPEFRSVIEVNLKGHEQAHRILMILDILQPLFCAMGKANGRHLRIDIVPFEAKDF